MHPQQCLQLSDLRFDFAGDVYDVYDALDVLRDALSISCLTRFRCLNLMFFFHLHVLLFGLVGEHCNAQILRGEFRAF